MVPNVAQDESAGCVISGGQRNGGPGTGDVEMTDALRHRGDGGPELSGAMMEQDKPRGMTVSVAPATFRMTPDRRLRLHIFSRAAGGPRTEGGLLFLHGGQCRPNLRWNGPCEPRKRRSSLTQCYGPSYGGPIQLACAGFHIARDRPRRILCEPPNWDHSTSTRPTTISSAVMLRH